MRCVVGEKTIQCVRTGISWTHGTDLMPLEKLPWTVFLFSKLVIVNARLVRGCYKAQHRARVHNW